MYDSRRHLHRFRANQESPSLNLVQDVHRYPPPVVVWGPSGNWFGSFLKRPAELYRYRELLGNQVARDLKARYRGTALGFFWCLLNPLLTTAILTLLFTVLMRGASIPNFAAFALIGVLAWNWHATALVAGINSITSQSNLMAKAYFPREVLPLSAVLSNGLNFLFALPTAIVLLVFSGVPIGWALLLLPFVFVIQAALSAGFALLLATANVFYRDTSIIMESLLLAWFFLTPIFYRPQDLFPQYERLMYILNPVASVIAMYRDLLYSGSVPDPLFVLRSGAQALVLLLVGWALFARFADRFVEEL
ncbi:MAG: ABC transporter permease [Chloroflexi bacterium]|nr:ABC transporter permease [Chloroflexota bacterium]